MKKEASFPTSSPICSADGRTKSLDRGFVSLIELNIVEQRANIGLQVTCLCEVLGFLQHLLHFLFFLSLLFHHLLHNLFNDFTPAGLRQHILQFPAALPEDWYPISLTNHSHAGKMMIIWTSLRYVNHTFFELHHLYFPLAFLRSWSGSINLLLDYVHGGGGGSGNQKSHKDGGCDYDL